MNFLTGLFLLFSVQPPVTFTADDLSGCWTGYITQEPATISDKYYWETNFDVDANQFKGFSVIRMEHEMEVFGKISFNGNWSGEHIRVQEEEVVSQNMYTWAYWCIKHVDLFPEWKDGEWILRGYWKSENCPGSGQIYLRKPGVS